MYTASWDAHCPGTKDEEAERDRIFANELAKNGLRLDDPESMCRQLKSNRTLLNDLDAKYGQMTLNYR